MRLAANLSWLYTEHEFPDRIKACAADGFSHAECMFPYDHPPGVLADIAEQAQVSWVLINAPAGNWAQGERGLACSPKRRDEFKRAAEQALAYASALRVMKVHVLAGVVDQNSQSAADQAWSCYAENLMWLADTMKAEPVQWLIEPINRIDMPGYLLHRQADAHSLLQQLDRENLGVQMDLYHCHRSEPDVLQALETYLPTGRVKHIQVAGADGRHEPGPEYAPLFLKLVELGYQGMVGCEYKPRLGTREGLDWIRRLGFSGTMEALKP